MLRMLFRRFITPTDERVTALETHVRVVYERLRELESAEAARAAEHAVMVDKLDRLFKRISARITRAQANGAPDESPLAMRQRLRGT